MSLTGDFLKHVLPGEGHYAAFVKETKRHLWFSDIDKLAAAVLAADAAGQTVYYACGSFRTATRRTASNSLGAASFWLDVDAGEGKPYADAYDAAIAVQKFVDEAVLRSPLYVKSGNGIYAIWPLAETLDTERWAAYARGLKHLCRRSGLEADPSRTSDIASILRAPGTHNRKNGLNKEVQCGPLVGPYPLEAFGRLLDVQVLDRRRAHGQRPALAAALASSFDGEDRFAEPIAAQCAQVGHLRSSGGRLPEPLWYACLGVLGYCRDAEQFGHQWSAAYDGYTYEETQERLERVKTLSGATTCEHFHSLNPKPCEACPHWGKIKSPISLGRQLVQTAEPINSNTNIFGEAVEEAEAESPPGLDLPQLPHDFFWRNDGALITKVGKDGATVDIVVSRYPIYLDSVQTGEVRGEFNLVFKQRIPDRGWCEISLPNRIVFGHASVADFADRGANIHEHQHFTRYVRGAIDMYYGAGKLTTRYDQFGWKDGDNAFLYGLDLYGPNGAQRVMGNDEIQIRCKEDWVGPCKGGNLESWKRAINALFAAGCEPQSVALLAAFAAPLMRYQERDEGGAIIHLVTRESGTGKSTALIGAASVWGRREGLGLTNDDTRISKALTLGALGNLPVIFDEIALRDPEAIRGFVINFTNGRDKMRATRMGEIRHTASTWQTIMISAANSSLVDVLSTQNTPEAPAYRIMEFGLMLPDELKHAQGDKLRKTLRANSGHAGKLYLKWLLQPANLAWTKTKLEEVTQQTWTYTRLGSEYRFWVRTIAAIAVAGVIVKNLGLVEFSVDRIMAWLFEQTRGHVVGKKAVDWAVPALSEFLNENVGSVLVVPGPFVQGYKLRPLQEPRYRLSIRYEMSTSRYLIACSALREWLVGKELSYQELARTLEGMGIVTRKRMQATLGAGTNIPGGQVWCLEVNAAHEALAGVAALTDKVVPLQRVREGLMG